jgi:MOSC domain-containing protein
VIGQLREIGRFPVKSMLGETLERATVAESGIAGDRAHALVDVETGKVASAKDPRLWADLLSFRARYVDPDGARAGAPLEMTLPDGTTVRSDDADAASRIGTAVGRAVSLESKAPADGGGQYDYVWEVDDLAPDEVVSGSQTGVTEEGRPLSTMPVALMAPGTFQDVAPITIMTTAALAAMAKHHPDGRWEQPRFRSNLVLDMAGDEGDDDEGIDGVGGIVENGWIGRRLTIGTAVFEVTAPTPRCVMTTLPQGDLPRDRQILRTVARANRLEFAGFGIWACLGVYASVVEPGEIALGDAVTLG